MAIALAYLASSDEASHSSSDNRGFCAEKVHRPVLTPDIFDRVHRIVPVIMRRVLNRLLVIFVPLQVIDVPLIVLIWVVIRVSAHVIILFPLVALRCFTEVVILWVALHPLNRNAFAFVHVNAIDHCAHEVALLGEGLRRHSGCQDGERCSFHIQICNYN